ncbi:amino acid adenylation domain-containing protein [Marinomonas mediterranea]|jgi:amino acid adenylation domain|uniref:Amino acid adenylation domain protein n=1 Tax=Marinomonas mediterranea (strain ATCC 700492 / JCM 21426 / NBRC 103028 / MMB-1) TaxID=717774 RepID=F2K078_MARM1|nr:amino acid adenylation domain-containing protein [Marinomonas mediterranea]ADZ93292.1 amino acid adenylation domain protein [Marinomonas mediterranea MMB-1]WCN19290.1 amino acid adenylation domain-containing protein [Marinomonas mediterranea MMB-1]
MKRLNYIFSAGMIAGEDNLAVSDTTESLTYKELNNITNQLVRTFQLLGVKEGDRVGLWLEKSCRGIACMLAISRLNASYVPIDPMNPLARVSTIIKDCQMSAIVISQGKLAKFIDSEHRELPLLIPDNLSLDDLNIHSDTNLSHVANWSDVRSQSSEHVDLDVTYSETDLAYILYTSGSTGVPKGVCINHLNACAFINWSIEEVEPRPEDRFSNHAPWHFDLSVFDIYVALGSGASVYLISEMVSYVPAQLVDFIEKNQISIWYSVPTALSLMMDAEPQLETRCSSLHTVIFAGEPFAIKKLKELRKRFPHKALYNFYGPTETNVSTYYKVPNEVPDKLPIGHVCSGDSLSLLDDNGTKVAIGEQGFITIKGPSVFSGYWGKTARTEDAYNTGDIGYFNDKGELMYVGRNDHMIKVKGYRIHLGEIETTIEKHPAIEECCVLLGEDKALHAYLVQQDDSALSLIKIKLHCSAHLPKYMLPDFVHFLPMLPRNGNGKVARKDLAALEVSA